MEGFNMNYSTNSNSSKHGKPGENGCNGTKYVLQKGDTLYSISRRYNVPLALILRANPYVDVYNLQIGDEICVPNEQQQELTQTLRPPVVTGPAPAASNTDNSTQRPEVRSMREQAAGTQERTSQTRTVVPVNETVTVPAENTGRNVNSESRWMQNERSTMPDTADVSRGTVKTSRTNSPASEIASRNTFNFNLYSGNSNSSVDKNSAFRERKQTERLRMRPNEEVTRQRPSNPVRRRVPDIEPNTESVESSNQMRSAIRPSMTAPARMKIPVRVMVKQKERTDMDTHSMAGNQKARNWNCYQDRERFNTIMYDKDARNCMEERRCTENIALPESKRQDEMGVVAYVSRENDSLRDILDYFTVDMDSLLQYNALEEFKLKPGCMLKVPGSCNEL